MKKRRTGRLNPALRSFVLVLTCFLLLLSVTACGRAQNESDASGSEVQSFDPAIRFGPENYNADLVVLSLEEVEDIGEAVIYREIDDLERLVARSPETILLVVVQPGQAIMHQLQPWLEQMAADEGGSLVLILANNTSDDPFLSSFEQSGWPSFFVIRNSAIKLSVYGFDESNQRLIKQTIDDLDS